MWTALPSSTRARRRVPRPGSNGMRLHDIRRYSRGNAVARRVVDRRRPSAANARHVGLAQPRRRLDQRIEHGLQIEGRAADDLEHVGGGGLLLQQISCAAR